MYRLSMLDLVEGGSSWEEIVQLAQGIEAAGATIINTGIGWHEARVPTIATCVPRAAFTPVTQKMMLEDAVSIPLVSTNRINTPAVAEKVLKDGHSDLVSMARPFLADPDIVLKAAQGRDDEVNPCIACNQACLDHSFVGKRASCLVNPIAGYESTLGEKVHHGILAEASRQRIAVVGSGPAGWHSHPPLRSAAITSPCLRQRIVLVDNSTWQSAFLAKKNSQGRSGTLILSSARARRRVRLSSS